MTSTRKLTTIAILGGISTVLMFISFPLPFFPQFLALDFSDVPAIIATFALGPVSGVAVEAIKALIHLMATKTSGVGELASFICGAAYVLVAGLIYSINKSKKNAIIAMIVSVCTTSIVAALVNIYLLLPAFRLLMGISSEMLISMARAVNPMVTSIDSLIYFVIVPFNIIKWAIVSIFVAVIYKKLSHFFH